MPRYTHPNPRETVEAVRRIELTWLRKHTYLKGYVHGKIFWSYGNNPSGDMSIRINTVAQDPYIQMLYRIKTRNMETYREMDYTIDMTSKPCRYGGNKWFFICRCSKVVRVLYEHSHYFKCRTCADLSYKSCNLSKRYRSGYFKVLIKGWNAEDYYRDMLKTKFYKGKPTRKYRKYLKMIEKIS